MLSSVFLIPSKMLSSDERQVFTQDKILTISAKEWADIEGRELKNYRAVGVQTNGCLTRECDKKGNATQNFGSIEEAFIKKVPNNAEAVVSYRAKIGYSGVSYSKLFSELAYHASGTALIKKSQKFKNKMKKIDIFYLIKFLIR